MAKRGRKSWTPPDLAVVEKLASQGMTDKQICACLGICQDTFYRKKKQFSEFSETVARGKAKGIALVTGKLMALVAAQDFRAIDRYLKSVAGWKETQVLQMKDFDPSTMSTEELEAIARSAAAKNDTE